MKTRARRASRAGRAGLVFALLGAGAIACTASQPPAPQWKLVWSDEFDNETALDPTKWTVDTGDSFGTNQQDFDTARPENISFADNHLVITARQESYMGASYTSGRIETNGLFSQAYGRFEASIQIPQGQGMWPAFWLLGQNYTSSGWPQCGEIDIMENRGADVTSVDGSLHGPDGPTSSAAYTFTAAYTLASSGTFAAGFHQFAVEWQPGVVRWYVDDNLYETQESDLFPRSETWVFNHPFFLILNLAVGGTFGGATDATTQFPQSMLVDYVRVYTQSN